MEQIIQTCISPQKANTLVATYIIAHILDLRYSSNRETLYRGFVILPKKKKDLKHFEVYLDPPYQDFSASIILSKTCFSLVG